MYEILKDIVVPLGAPLVAIITLLLFVSNERKKYLIEAEYKVHARAGAIKRDLEIMLETYKAHVGYQEASGKIDSKRVKMIEETSDRLFQQIYQDSLVYDMYLKYEGIPLLLSELEVRLRDPCEEAKNDPFLYFSFLRLLSLLEDDKEKKANYESACNLFVKNNPDLYSHFMGNCG